MRTFLLLLMLSLMPVAGAVAAPVPITLAAAGQISLDEAVRQVKAATGGRVVSSGPAKRRGRSGYRIRVVVEGGRVMTYFVDAESGAMQSSG